MDRRIIGFEDSWLKLAELEASCDDVDDDKCCSWYFEV
jgi:hypothetical protein